MRKTIPAFFILFLFTLMACGSKPIPNVSNSLDDQIPDGAIPFDYNRSKKILLKGQLNDSIPLNIFFDTGGGSGINITDSLKWKFGNGYGSTGKVQIGKYTKSLPIYFNSGVVSKVLGSNGAIVNWRFFEGKIIKICFQHKYLQVLENNANTTGYDSIKMKINRGRFLTIPAYVHLQGKVISEDFWFDTGLNCPVYMESRIVDKYALNMDSVQHATGITHTGKFTNYWISADSAGVGKYFVPIYTLSFGDGFKDDKNITAIIGNGFFENFDLILDFKNFNLYIKPIVKNVTSPDEINSIDR